MSPMLILIMTMAHLRGIIVRNNWVCVYASLTSVCCTLVPVIHACIEMLCVFQYIDVVYVCDNRTTSKPPEAMSHLLSAVKIVNQGISCITPEPWVNDFVAKETPIRFQNCFASWGWQLQWCQKIARRLFVSVCWLLPKPKTLSVGCCLSSYSLT